MKGETKTPPGVHPEQVSTAKDLARTDIIERCQFSISRGVLPVAQTISRTLSEATVSAIFLQLGSPRASDSEWWKS